MNEAVESHLPKGKIKAVLFGNGFGFIVSLLSQFVSVPLLVRYWGDVGYGKWILYYNLPNFIAFYGSSLTTIGANRAVLAAQGGDSLCVREVIAKTLIILSITLVSAFVIFAMVFYLTPGSFLATYRDYSLIYTLVAASLISMMSYIAEAPYRAIDKFGRCLVIFNCNRLVEAFLIIACSAIGGNLMTAAMMVLISKLVFICIIGIDLFKQCPQFLPIPSDLRLKTVQYKDLFFESLHSVAYVSSTLMRQALPLPLVGARFGTPAAAQFNSIRTLSRLPGFVMLIINNSIKSELTKFHRKDLMSSFTSLYWKGVIGVAAVGLGSLFFLNFGGSYLFNFWMRNKVMFSQTLLMWSVIQGFFEYLLAAAINPLMAVNRHARISWVILMGTSVATVCSYYFLDKGAAWTLIPLCVVDATLIVVVWVYKMWCVEPA